MRWQAMLYDAIVRSDSDSVNRALSRQPWSRLAFNSQAATLDII